MALSGFLIDSNVILDVVTENGRWFEWSSETLDRVSSEGPLITNPIVYAEVSVGFQRNPLPREAAFLAGKCFLKYGRNGG